MSVFKSTDIKSDRNHRDKILSLFPKPQSYLSPFSTDLSPSLQPIDDIKMILFDVYGTLIISQSGDVGTASEKSKVKNFLALMEAIDLKPLNDEMAEKIEETFFKVIRNIHEVMKKNNILYPEVDIISVWDETCRIVFPFLESPPEITLDLLVQLSIIYESLSNQTALMPGMVDLLKNISDHKLEMGIISNAQFYTPLLIEHLTGKSLEFLNFNPDLLVWSYLERLGKPSIELFEKAAASALSKYTIKSDNILYIGNDMRNDIFPAAKIGMKTALFAGDRRSLRLREKDPLYSYIKPDIILTDLGQLMELLQVR